MYSRLVAIRLKPSTINPGTSGVKAFAYQAVYANADAIWHDINNKVNIFPIWDANLLMCPSYGDVTGISGCVNSIINGLFSSPRCDCYAEHQTYTTDDCPRCDVKITQMTIDNAQPVQGCIPESDIMNISATIKGGCNPLLQQPIRARFRQELAQIEVGDDERFSDYFTHVKLIPSLHDVFELIAREDPFGPNDGTNPEIKYDFPNLNALLNINFKLRYTPSSTIEEVTHHITLFIGTNQFASSDVSIDPFIPITVQPGQTVRDLIAPFGTARNYHINGDLDFQFVIPPVPPIPGDFLYDPSPPANSSGIVGYNFTDFDFLMNPGNKFHINPDVKLKLINGSVKGCESMWEGIELEEGASIECVSSTLEDAQFAIRLKGSGIADIRQSTFENNNFSFQALKPIGSSSPILVVSGNTFINTAALKPSYSGQSPLPFGGRGYAGIYIDRIPSLNISSSGGSNNLFKNLHNGTGILPTDPSNFTNCHTAIESFQSSLTVTNNMMTSVHNGVISNIGINKKVFVSTNDIQAQDRGIAVFHALALPNGCQVNSNTVRMIGNAQGVGIKTGGTDNLPQQEGFFSLNTVILTDGAAGIDVGASRNFKVTNSTITLNNGSTYYGIGISGGDLNGVNCNTINGVGQKGIYGIMAGRSNFVCNTASGTGIGLNFEGVFVGKGSIRVAGNTMHSNAGNGLLIKNNGLSGTGDYRTNEKTVNTIYLQTVAFGNNTFSATQLAALHPACGSIYSDGLDYFVLT